MQQNKYYGELKTVFKGSTFAKVIFNKMEIFFFLFPVSALSTFNGDWKVVEKLQVGSYNHALELDTKPRIFRQSLNFLRCKQVPEYNILFVNYFLH